MGNEYGYVRVSTKEQHEDRQLIAMQNFGLSDGQIIVEKQSGKDFKRPKYERLIRRMRKGDVLIVKSIDRLGRNYEEILEQWRRITKKKQVSIVVLDMPLLDTRQGKDLTGILIGDIVLQLLSYVAQTERENIRQRQREGIEAARRKGVHMGRPSIPVPESFGTIYRAYRAGEITSRVAGEKLAVSATTFLRWVKQHDKQYDKMKENT